MHQSATLNKWYQERGRHLIYAGNKSVDLPTTSHSLVLNAEDVHHGVQTDLDERGIAKTARDEKRRARDAAVQNLVKTPEDERMEKLYRETVLKQKPEQPGTGFVQIDV
jgi:hypothetical protein